MALAQDSYRDRMKEDGFRRLQEWLPDGAYTALQAICKRHGITQREALIRSIKLGHKNRVLLEDL